MACTYEFSSQSQRIYKKMQERCINGNSSSTLESQRTFKLDTRSRKARTKSVNSSDLTANKARVLSVNCDKFVSQNIETFKNNTPVKRIDSKEGLKVPFNALLSPPSLTSLKAAMSELRQHKHGVLPSHKMIGDSLEKTPRPTNNLPSHTPASRSLSLFSKFGSSDSLSPHASCEDIKNCIPKSLQNFMKSSTIKKSPEPLYRSSDRLKRERSFSSANLTALRLMRDNARVIKCRSQDIQSCNDRGWKTCSSANNSNSCQSPFSNTEDLEINLLRSTTESTVSEDGHNTDKNWDSYRCNHEFVHGNRGETHKKENLNFPSENLEQQSISNVLQNGVSKDILNPTIPKLASSRTGDTWNLNEPQLIGALEQTLQRGLSMSPTAASATAMELSLLISSLDNMKSAARVSEEPKKCTCFCPCASCSTCLLRPRDESNQIRGVRCHKFYRKKSHASVNMLMSEISDGRSTLLNGELLSPPGKKGLTNNKAQPQHLYDSRIIPEKPVPKVWQTILEITELPFLILWVYATYWMVIVSVTASSAPSTIWISAIVAGLLVGVGLNANAYKSLLVPKRRGSVRHFRAARALLDKNKYGSSQHQIEMVIDWGMIVRFFVIPFAVSCLSGLTNNFRDDFLLVFPIKPFYLTIAILCPTIVVVVLSVVRLALLYKLKVRWSSEVLFFNGSLVD